MLFSIQRLAVGLAANAALTMHTRGPNGPEAGRALYHLARYFPLGARALAKLRTVALDFPLPPPAAPATAPDESAGVPDDAVDAEFEEGPASGVRRTA